MVLLYYIKKASSIDKADLLSGCIKNWNKTCQHFFFRKVRGKFSENLTRAWLSYSPKDTPRMPQKLFFNPLLALYALIQTVRLLRSNAFPVSYI